MIYAPSDTLTRGLDKVYEIMNHNTAGVEWRLVVVGPDRKVAEFARYHQILTGFWARMPVYACELPLGAFTEDDVQQLWDNLNEVSIYSFYNIVNQCIMPVLMVQTGQRDVSYGLKLKLKP